MSEVIALNLPAHNVEIAAVQYRSSSKTSTTSAEGLSMVSMMVMRLHPFRSVLALVCLTLSSCTAFAFAMIGHMLQRNPVDAPQCFGEIDVGTLTNLL